MTDPGFISLDDAERRQGVPLDGANEPPPVMNEGEYGAAAPTSPPPDPARVLPKSVSDAMTTSAPLNILEPETWEGKLVPETRWIIRGPIPALAVCSLGGHGDTGKSILGLQAGVARALDRDWLGFPASYGKTLIVSCEDPKEQIHIRLASILRHYGATFADLGDRLRIIDRNDMVNSMMDWRSRWEPGEVSSFYCQTMNYALQMYADLIVIDSRYDVFVGEQNDTPQVTEFMTAAMRTLAREINGAVLLLAHPSRSGLDSGDGESGSVAWHNKARSRMYLRQADPERDGDCDRVLEHLKSNWGQKFEPVHLRWSDGAFVADRPSTGIIGTIERGKAEAAFLDALDAISRQGRMVSDKPNSGNYAAKVMMGMTATQGVNRRSLEVAMKRLFDAGEIVNCPYGSPSRGNTKIIRRIEGNGEC